jgi:hypothetical protein
MHKTIKLRVRKDEHFFNFYRPKKEAENYILDYISSHNVNDIITLLSTVK